MLALRQAYYNVTNKNAKTVSRPGKYNMPMPPILQSIFIALLGWASGAFVNYISDVLPYRRKLVQPFCPSCQAPYSLVNYFLLPRRCPSCQKPRPGRTWLVEAAFILAAVWTWSRPSESLGFWLGWVVLVLFGVVVVIDMEHRLILHPVSITGALMGFAIGVIAYGTPVINGAVGGAPFLNLQPGTLPHGLAKTLIGGAAGFGIMFLFFFLGNLLARVIGRLRGQPVEEEALGYGDVNLSGVLGLIVAWDRIIYALFFGILIGAIGSLLYLVVKSLMRKYTLFTAIPYGPFLIAGAVIILFL
jgi:leader peptidase (prepilin peptidase)/N-methyltransferase